LNKLVTVLGAILCTLSFQQNAIAGAGHDHGDDAKPQFQSDNAPKRLANGNVYLPKQSQRQLGIRTTVAEYGEFSRSVDLAGKIVHNPNFGGKVQAMVAGRISPPPNGFPIPGQEVKKGELLGYITPDIGPGTTRSLAESRLKRLQALSDTVPRKTLEEAQAAVANEELRAPVAGTIATTGVVSGQVVEPRQLIFEIVNPNTFMVEALAYDPALLGMIASANLAIGNEVITLKYLGGAKSLREQALPITFTASDDSLSKLAIGSPVRIFVQTNQKVTGFKVPSSALVRDSSNQSLIWIKEDLVLFEPHTVVPEPLDGANVLVQGLHKHDRVVSKCASLLKQIR